ncbi:hypothetical protein AMTR_s00090p00062790 [Amborella trichopoda]|uniref:Uncharacterized protein n=1 Tax=Amborella trichopoda TaxID=13333 RepID=W1P1W1_AMBTC|nr:hypothetical protein AMTR_s00090p00062790 [Amborella trichopoda]
MLGNMRTPFPIDYVYGRLRAYFPGSCKSLSEQNANVCLYFLHLMGCQELFHSDNDTRNLFQGEDFFLEKLFPIGGPEDLLYADEQPYQAGLDPVTERGMMYLLSIRGALLPLRLGFIGTSTCIIPTDSPSCIKIAWDSYTSLGMGRKVIIPHYNKEVYKTYTYCLWCDNHQRGFHKTLLTKLPPMKEDGTFRTHYKSKINVDAE